MIKIFLESDKFSHIAGVTLHATNSLARNQLLMMIDSCLIYAKSCQVCNRQKKSHKKPKVHHVSYHAGLPMERVHIDILGVLVEIPRGNQYVFVVVDQFSKWVECYALSD